MKHVVITDRFDHIDAAKPRAAGWYPGAPKRAFDIALAILIMPVVAPVIAVLWLLTRLDGGKGFFGHTRIGHGGAAFKCWKIRTMVPDAEAKLQHYLAENPAAAAQWVREYKLDNDPRITRIGNFLRKTSLDELPQIWNVICGEMSFVGPRPVIEAELVKYHGSEWAYLSMRPGITGLWQVSGRNDVSYAERVQMDVEYNRSLSLMGDLRIILKTGLAVVNRTGR